MKLGSGHLDAQTLIVEVNGGLEGTGPRVEEIQGSGGQGQQGEDDGDRERGEQNLEKEFHGAGAQRIKVY